MSLTEHFKPNVLYLCCSLLVSVSDFPWEVRANDRQFHRKQQRRSILCFHKGKYAVSRITEIAELNAVQSHILQV